MSNAKKSILPIFFTVFIDLLGIGIIIPILPAVILNPSSGLVPMDLSFSARSILYGFVVACFPIFQLFGAPILGVLADRYGRRKVLVASLIGTLLGYVLIAVGILTHNILLLFWGRSIDGFTGGNISIAQSAISDISDHTNRAKNFGLIGMAFGLGFILGPYLGGVISDPATVSWFNFETPFWLAAIMTLINILMVLVLFPETLQQTAKGRIDALAGFRNIAKAYQIRQMRMMFLVVFFLTIGFNFFTQFFQVFLIGKFQFTQSQIGMLFAYMGIWIAIAQGAIVRPLTKRFTPVQILSWSSLLLALTFPLLLLPSKVIWIYAIIPFVAVLQGLTQPNSTAIVSGLCDRRSQGQILGINQSVTSLGQAVPPIIAGFVTAININLPTLFAAGATLLAWLVFTTVKRLHPEAVEGKQNFCSPEEFGFGRQGTQEE